MARIGRTVVGHRYAGPVLINPLPTQQQTTIRTNYGIAVGLIPTLASRRKAHSLLPKTIVPAVAFSARPTKTSLVSLYRRQAERHTFPPQWMEPSQTRVITNAGGLFGYPIQKAGASTSIGQTQLWLTTTTLSEYAEVYGFNLYMVNSTAPRIVRPLIYSDSAGAPGTLVAIGSEYTIATNNIGFLNVIPINVGLPPGTYWFGLWGDNTVSSSGFYTSTSVGNDTNQYTVTYSSTGNPGALGGATPHAFDISMAALYVAASPYGVFERALGPDPPGLIGGLPTLAQQTIRATKVAVRTVKENLEVRQTFFDLQPPAVIRPLPTQQMQTVETTLEAIAERLSRLRKQPHWELSGPTVLAQPPPRPIAVTLVAAQSRLGSTRRFPLQGWEFVPSFAYLDGATPTPPLLDDFNRANGDPGPNWGVGVSGGSLGDVNHLVINGNQAASQVGLGSSYWAPDIYGDCEFYFDVPVLPVGAGISLYYRIDNPVVDTFSGYDVGYNVTQQRIKVARWDSGVVTTLAQPIHPIAAGDSYGVRVQGAVHTFWHKPAGGAWQIVASVTDSTYTRGSMALQIPDTTARVDNLIGGAFPSAGVLRSPFLGPRPPQLFPPLPTLPQETLSVTTRVARQAPRAQARRTRSFLSPPILAATTFVAPPISVNLQDNRVRGFGRRHFPSAVLGPPTTLQVFSGPRVALTHTRPRHTISVLGKPTVIRVPSVEQAEDTIRATLVRTRPRPTRVFLNPPTAVFRPPFFGPEITLVHTRPRATRHTLGPLIFYPQTSEIQATLVRSRPRPTAKRLGAPTTLQVFQGARTTLTHTRPRHTIWSLRPPTVIRVPSVEQQEDTIRVSLVKTRPRPTTRKLSPPTVIIVNPPVKTALTVWTVRRVTRPAQSELRPPTAVIPLPTQQMQTIAVKVVRRVTRPFRSTTIEPLVVRVPSVEQAEDTIRTLLVKTRPRPTTRKLSPPTVVIVNPPVKTVLTVWTTRRVTRPAQSELHPPTAVIPLPTLQMQTVRVQLVHTRPRPTIHHLSAVRYPQTSEIAVTLARTRPRPTTKRLQPPTVLSTAVFPGPDVTLARTRPRPTTRRLSPPTVVTTGVFFGPDITTVKTRPRHTISSLTAVRYPQTSEILVALVRTRPRPTSKRLFPPTTLRVFQGARVAITRIRPRHTIARVFPPTKINPIPSLRQQTLTIWSVRRVFRPGRWKLNPPTAVTPPPRLAVLVIKTWLVAVQNALRLNRRQPHPKLAPPAVINPKHGYFNAEPPSGYWTAGPPDAVKTEEFAVWPPESGWSTGRLSVDTLTDIPDEDWEAGNPL